MVPSTFIVPTTGTNWFEDSGIREPLDIEPAEENEPENAEKS